MGKQLQWGPVWSSCKMRQQSVLAWLHAELNTPAGCPQDTKADVVQGSPLCLYSKDADEGQWTAVT